jgi:tubulin-specific chaperone D
MRYF